MLDIRIEKLRQEYTDRYVVVEGDRPEYRRFRGRIGQVKTISVNGRALVQFTDCADQAWYDLDLDYLKIVEPPPAATAHPEKNPSSRTASLAGRTPLRLHGHTGKISSTTSSYFSG